ncbi:MAG: DUF3040 domain-containing protein [Acidimicrobiales bacterium]
MPLSEDEQRILQEIEQQFYETDPAFVREVESTTLYRHAFRNLKWATAGFLVGVAILVWALLNGNVLVAFIGGFLVMLGSAIWFEQNLRRLGRAGWQQMTNNMRASGIRSAWGDTRRRMRDRFRKED